MKMCNIYFIFQTDDAISEDSYPESWSSLNDQNSLDAMKELVNHHVNICI